MTGPADVFLPANGLGQTYILEPQEAVLLRELALQRLRSNVLFVDALVRIRQGQEHSNAATVFRNEVQQLLALGPSPDGPPLTELSPRAERVARALEFDFIWDGSASSIDLIAGLRPDQLASTPALPRDPRERALTYRGNGKAPFAIEWDDNDYPGNGGPHDALTKIQSRDLTKLCPERRVNQGAVALCTAAQYPGLAREIEDNCRLLPTDLRSPRAMPPVSPTHPSGFRITNNTAKGFLLENAITSFTVMAAAAQREYRVPLVVGSGYRTSAVAQRNAELRGNNNAVARFSPHMLGVAFDLLLSYDDQAGKRHNFTETTTTPFSNVLNMRTSPAHKFMFLFGAKYGWFPFMFEPWHWEFNPPGLDVFPSGQFTQTDPFAVVPPNPFNPFAR